MGSESTERVNAFTLFLILILLLASTGALATILRTLLAVTPVQADTYDS